MPDQSPSEHPCPASPASSSTACSSTVVNSPWAWAAWAWVNSLQQLVHIDGKQVLSPSLRAVAPIIQRRSSQSCGLQLLCRPVPVGLLFYVTIADCALRTHAYPITRAGSRSQRLRGGALACIGSCGALPTFLPHRLSEPICEPCCHRCLRSATRCRTRIVGRRWKRRLHAGCFALL
jgi:hypothetical protein